MEISKDEYENAKRIIEKYESRQKYLSKYSGRSSCPFCGGSKTKPFIRHGRSQDCTECDHKGTTSNRLLASLDLHECITAHQ